jgi:hypothetical protein
MFELFALAAALAVTETLHGIVRNAFIAPKIGRKRAQRYSIFSGTRLAFGLCYAALPFLPLQTVLQHLMAGIFLALFMALYDMVLARFVFHYRWAAIKREFDPKSGNYLLYGLLMLCFIPLVTAFLR